VLDLAPEAATDQAPGHGDSWNRYYASLDLSCYLHTQVLCNGNASRLPTIHSPNKHLDPPALSALFAQAPPDPLATSFASLASSFFLAASIMSSLRRCSSVCLSSRTELHALPPLPLGPRESSSGALAAADAATFSCRLYRVMRSGWDGVGVCVRPGAEAPAGVWVVCVAGGGAGWNVTGGWRASGLVSQSSRGHPARHAVGSRG
jgi:hypothetical protein